VLRFTQPYCIFNVEDDAGEAAGLRIFNIKTILLPRQARDKHGENSKRGMRFAGEAEDLAGTRAGADAAKKLTGTENEQIRFVFIAAVFQQTSLCQDRLGTSTKKPLETKEGAWCVCVGAVFCRAAGGLESHRRA
jgi:hypothetical protein